LTSENDLERFNVLLVEISKIISELKAPKIVVQEIGKIIADFLE